MSDSTKIEWKTKQEEMQDPETRMVVMQLTLPKIHWELIEKQAAMNEESESALLACILENAIHRAIIGSMNAISKLVQIFGDFK